MVAVGMQTNGLTFLNACHALILVHTPGPNAQLLEIREHGEAIRIQGRFTSRIPCFPHARDRAIVRGRLYPDGESRDEQLVVVHRVDIALLRRFAHQLQRVWWVPMTQPQPRLHILPTLAQHLVQGFHFIGTHSSSMKIPLLILPSLTVKATRSLPRMQYEEPRR